MALPVFWHLVPLASPDCALLSPCISLWLSHLVLFYLAIGQLSLLLINERNAYSQFTEGLSHCSEAAFSIPICRQKKKKSRLRMLRDGDGRTQ